MPEKAQEINTEPRRWFRFYAESVNDPKVQRLPAHLFKTWVNLLCLASTNGGTLPSREDIAFQLRMSDHDANSQIDELIGLGLIDITSGKSLEPHNWKSRQYVSDTSKQRTRKYRDKLKQACDVTVTTAVTPPDTDTDTDTDTNQRSADTPREVAALPDVNALRELSKRLHKVAEPCLASEAIAPGLMVMTIPQMWLDHGADLERDVIPVIQSTVARGKKNVSSWDYFTKAVAENKAKREAGLPTVNIQSSPLGKKRLDLSKLNIVESPPEAYR